MMEGLNSGQYDIALCGIYQTPERAAEIDFLPAYLNSGLRLLVRWSFALLFQSCFTPSVSPLNSTSSFFPTLFVSFLLSLTSWLALPPSFSPSLCRFVICARLLRRKNETLAQQHLVKNSRL